MLSAKPTALYQWVCFFFHSISLCHEKVMPGHTKWCTRHGKNHFGKPDSFLRQNTTHFSKSAPWPLNMFAGYVSCTAPATRNTFVQILFECPMPAIVFGTAAKPTRWNLFAPASKNDAWTSNSGTHMSCFSHFHFEMCFVHLCATMPCTFSTSQLPKVLRSWGALASWLPNLLGPTVVCTFLPSQFPKVFRSWSVLNFRTFWHCHVFRATTARTFWTL